MAVLGLLPTIKRQAAVGGIGFDAESYRRQCLAAEDAGFAAVYSGEHHAGVTAYSSHPLVLAQDCLARTSRLRAGPNLLLLPLHHPIEVGETAALIDALHPGRLRLAVGAGYVPDEFDVYGVGIDERPARMEAGTKALAAFRAGRAEPIDAPFTGRVPEREPGMPEPGWELFMGAWSPAGVRRAARLADGWVADPIRNLAHIEHLARLYRDECARVGKTPRIVLTREAWLAGTDEEAERVIGPRLLEHHRTYFRRGNAYEATFDPWIRTLASAEDMTLGHVLPDRVLYGSAATWARTLADWHQRLGFEEIIVRVGYLDGPDTDVVLDQIGRIGAEVIGAGLLPGSGT